MNKTLLLIISAICLGACGSFAQRSGYVYHTLGPAWFTNATAQGYADGQLVGTNFYCGVYAGTSASSLAPCFAGPDGLLRRFTPSGWAMLSGDLTIAAPPGGSILIQFRAWSADFDTYEQALAAGGANTLAGLSAIGTAIPPNVIVEVPIQAGPLWVSPVPEPATLTLLASGAVGIVAVNLRFCSRARGLPSPPGRCR